VFVSFRRKNLTIRGQGAEATHSLITKSFKGLLWMQDSAGLTLSAV
jgi:hypothetical protein